MRKPQTVLVLQGGGALGAYQGGAYTGLADHNIDIDWVVGTSIGAINGAIIAGNRPDKRAEKLHGFWQRIASDENLDMFAIFGDSSIMRQLQSNVRTMQAIAGGVAGFFKPRQPFSLNLSQAVHPAKASFYDTSPLEESLNTFVDFDYLNAGHVRYTACAVDVASCELVRFENRNVGGRRKEALTARHVMASGALPPGFAPVEIDGKFYFDGGIYSNTPIDIVLDDAERADTLCFMIDLWDPTESVPNSIAEAMARQKDIQYASRSSEHLADHKEMQNLRHAIRVLASQIPKAKQDDAVKILMRKGCESKINIVRVIMKALPNDGHMKDIDFSRATVNKRWGMGRHDIDRALRKKSWLQPLPDHVGMAVHELHQE